MSGLRVHRPITHLPSTSTSTQRKRGRVRAERALCKKFVDNCRLVPDDAKASLYLVLEHGHGMPTDQGHKESCENREE